MTFNELLRKINDLGAGMHKINNFNVQVYNHLHQANFLTPFGNGVNVVWDSDETPTIYRVCEHIADYDQPIRFRSDEQIPVWCRIPNLI